MKTFQRWKDAEAQNNTGITDQTLRLVVDQKRQIVLDCREMWPKYASFEEDFALMKDRWKKRYAGKRDVFWDDTNISFNYKPSDADTQRMTYSAYYGENCAKAGVFVQLCGWGGANHLWAGGTSDTQYLNDSGILETQEIFSRNDLVDDGKGGRTKVPFTNILDKGYRSTVAAWQAGKQLVSQPDFKRSDRKFRAVETISSAGIATDRSSNERQVNRCKMTGEVSRGLQPGRDYTRLDDAWLAFSFQVNFMFKSVL